MRSPASCSRRARITACCVSLARLRILQPAPPSPPSTSRKRYSIGVSTRASRVLWRPMRLAMSRGAMTSCGSCSRACDSSVPADGEREMASPHDRGFVANMDGARPSAWSEGLSGWDRLRVIVNAMTRMRFCTRDGRMEFQAKGVDPPPGYIPWYAARPAEEETIVCGHWSALGLKLTDRLAALDTGCVWGGKLTALRLEDRALYQVPCPGYQAAGGEG